VISARGEEREKSKMFARCSIAQAGSQMAYIKLFRGPWSVVIVNGHFDIESTAFVSHPVSKMYGMLLHK
jgi:hypothetical protein